MDDQALIEKAAGQRSDAATRDQLGRGEWLAAALALFVREGIGAVRITRLAAHLGVTRGSFYWHFEDRQDLLDAVIGFWSNKNTAAVLRATERAASLTDGIFALFDAWVDPALFDPRLDLAMREWARRSDAVRRAVDDADDMRISAITRLYRRFGYPMPEALIRARVIYFTQIGFYALEVSEPLAVRLSYLEAYFECFTGKVLDPEAARAHRGRVIAKFAGNAE